MQDNPILYERELRSIKARQYAAESNIAVVKANIPGIDKNIPEADFLISVFLSEIEKNVLEVKELCFGADGTYAFCVVPNAEEFKNLAVKIEEEHPLGRFIDIDVIPKGENKSLTREKMRRCFLCDKPAFVCAKERNHTLKELLYHIRTATESYLEKLFEDIIFDSLLCELSLENKFGLVSPSSSASHPDMSFDMMKNAAKTISKKLPEAFLIGMRVSNLGEILPMLRTVGLECEREMFSSTNGINAYKGFIFIACVLLGAAGYVTRNSLKYDKIYEISKVICADENLFADSDTFGYEVYKWHGFGGIRENARSGFLSVKETEELLRSYEDTDEMLYLITKIVERIDDSVLYKRAGNYERYLFFRNLISKTDVKNKQQLKKVNEMCEKENISIGGTADVLIASVMMRKIRENLFFRKVNKK